MRLQDRGLRVCPWLPRLSVQRALSRGSLWPEVHGHVHVSKRWRVLPRVWHVSVSRRLDRRGLHCALSSGQVWTGLCPGDWLINCLLIGQYTKHFNWPRTATVTMVLAVTQWTECANANLASLATGNDGKQYI